MSATEPAQMERITFIPEDCVGLVIGRRKSRLRQISAETGAYLTVRKGEIYIAGEQEAKAQAYDQIWSIILATGTVPMEKVTIIPEHCMGLVIGRGRSRLREISAVTGAHLTVQNREIYIAGQQEAKAQAYDKIRSIIESRKQRISIEEKEKLSFIPEEAMGLVIGRGRYTLRKISSDTGAKLHHINGEIYVSGSAECRAKAKLKVKEIVVIASLGHLSGRRLERVVKIDTSCIRKDAVFQLEPVPLPNPTWQGKGNFYRLTLDDESELQTSRKNESDMGQINDPMLRILHCLHEAADLEVDMWCHFGHVYIAGIDLETKDDELFTVSDIERNFVFEEEEKESESALKQKWKPHFKEGMTEIEVRTLEKSMENNVVNNSKEDRWDFDFLTPSCKKIHSKVWLVKNDARSSAYGVSEFDYVLHPPREVRNQLGRVLSEELGTTNSSREPSFYLCANCETAMTIDVILPGHRFDCRIIIRCWKKDNSGTLNTEVKREVDAVADYLRCMRADDNGITILNEIPEGYQLSYKRRSQRQTYHYNSNGLPCRLTVCKETSEELVSEDESKPHIDIHLRCDEWDEAFANGQWHPEQIVEKLPNFLKFVKVVQMNLQKLDQDSQR